MRKLIIQSATVLLAAILASVANADSNDDVLERLVVIRIDAQPLSTALIELSKQARVQVMTPAEKVKSLSTQGVHGEMSLALALTKLLEGTRLGFHAAGENVVGLDDNRDATTSSRIDQEQIRLAGAFDFQDAEAGGRASQNADESNLEEIIVSAQKRVENLQDVPISISVLTGDKLDKSTAHSITEELNRVPGVAAEEAAQGGGTIIRVRGVAPNGGLFSGSSPIAYYLDGVPFGLVDTAIAPNASGYDLQRVEVLRGPQGTLYGASALNGVVRVLTQDADLDQLEFKARTSGSSTDHGGGNYRADAAFNAPIVPGKMAARAVLGYQRLGGWIDNPNENNANDGRIRNARLKINAQPTERLSIGMSAWLSRQDYGAPTNSNDQRQSNSLVREPGVIDLDSYGFKVGYEFSGFSLSSMTGYLKYASADTTDFLNATAGAFSYPLFESFDAAVFSQEINLNSTYEGVWQWSAGAIYRDAENSTAQELGRDGDSALGGEIQGNLATLDWTNTSKSYAVFGELRRRFLNDKLEATLGGRYFHDEVATREDDMVDPLVAPFYYRDKVSFNSTTPRVVLTWRPDENHTVYGSYSEGFRSGAPQTYYSTGGLGGFPAAKPDKLSNYELGAKADLLDRRFSLDTAVYFMDWQDVQQILSVPFNGVCCVGTLVNSKAASGLGFDLGLTARPYRGLELGATFSWNDLTFDEDVITGTTNVLFPKGDRLSGSPEYTAGASADYVFTLGGSGLEGRLSAAANYTSVQKTRGFDGEGNLLIGPGDPMVITRASFSIGAADRWEATLFGDNLGDEDGAIVRDPFSPLGNTGLRARPRTIGIQLEYRSQ